MTAHLSVTHHNTAIASINQLEWTDGAQIWCCSRANLADEPQRLSGVPTLDEGIDEIHGTSSGRLIKTKTAVVWLGDRTQKWNLSVPARISVSHDRIAICSSKKLWIGSPSATAPVLLVDHTGRSKRLTACGWDPQHAGRVWIGVENELHAVQVPSLAASLEPQRLAGSVYSGEGTIAQMTTMDGYLILLWDQLEDRILSTAMGRADPSARPKGVLESLLTLTEQTPVQSHAWLSVHDPQTYAELCRVPLQGYCKKLVAEPTTRRVYVLDPTRKETQVIELSSDFHHHKKTAVLLDNAEPEYLPVDLVAFPDTLYVLLGKRKKSSTATLGYDKANRAEYTLKWTAHHHRPLDAAQ
ncbi:hypothetical protein HDU91_001571, partial [Kappamyces sp. JEL0680]